jgi:hypothetical protein
MNSIKPTAELESVMQLWSELLPFEPPDKFAVNLWLRRHGVETALYSIAQAAIKRAKGGEMGREYAIRLCGAICCSVTRAKKQCQVTA